MPWPSDLDNMYISFLSFFSYGLRLKLFLIGKVCIMHVRAHLGKQVGRRGGGGQIHYNVCLFVCFNYDLAFESTTMVMLRLCLHFIGLLPNTRMS